MQALDRYIGIDYSGAETPKASLKGLRVYMAVHNEALRRYSRRRARADTGHETRLPTGWWYAFWKVRERWSGSTTAFPSR